MERGSLMLNTTAFVGLDVHARSIKAVALDAMTGEVRSATFAYDAAAVAEWVESLDPAAKCVYESGSPPPSTPAGRARGKAASPRPATST